METKIKVRRVENGFIMESSNGFTAVSIESEGVSTEIIKGLNRFLDCMKDRDECVITLLFDEDSKEQNIIK